FNPGALVLSDNVSIDNKRFNYLFRKSPYSGEIEQGTFTNNRSYRFHVNSKYDDVINSAKSTGNALVENGTTYTSDGKAVDSKTLAPLKQASVI
ncbi:right-handed parallel beta-helix repeat-containing protein, partial [Escherichia coli]|nr:right-handed parallel beta-helix repeat-containing protein [Escherichia coli]